MRDSSDFQLPKAQAFLRACLYPRVAGRFDRTMKIHCVELTRQGRSEAPDELSRFYRGLAATRHRNVPGERTSRYVETSPQTYSPNRTTKQTLASRT